MTLWTEDTERRADMAHWLGHGRWVGPTGDAEWRTMGLRHVLYLSETAAVMPWDGEAQWPPLTVLDYGCGGGSTVAALRALECAVYAIDVIEDNIRAAALHNQHLTVPDPGERFDAAVCTAVLQHVTPDEACAILQCIADQLLPGAVALISTRRPQPGDVPGDVCSLTTWTMQEAARELRRAGFVVHHEWAHGSQDYWGCRRV